MGVHGDLTILNFWKCSARVKFQTFTAYAASARAIIFGHSCRMKARAIDRTCLWFAKAFLRSCPKWSTVRVQYFSSAALRKVLLLHWISLDWCSCSLAASVWPSILWQVPWKPCTGQWWPRLRSGDVLSRGPWRWKHVAGWWRTYADFILVFGSLFCLLFRKYRGTFSSNMRCRWKSVGERGMGCFLVYFVSARLFKSWCVGSFPVFWKLPHLDLPLAVREIRRSMSQSGLSQLRPGSDSDTASTARIQPKYSPQILELCFVVLLASAMFAWCHYFLDFAEVLLHYDLVSYSYVWILTHTGWAGIVENCLICSVRVVKWFVNVCDLFALSCYSFRNFIWVFGPGHQEKKSCCQSGFSLIRFAVSKMVWGKMFVPNGDSKGPGSWQGQIGALNRCLQTRRGHILCQGCMPRLMEKWLCLVFAMICCQKLRRDRSAAWGMHRCEALPEEAQELLRSLGPMLCDLCHSVVLFVVM